MQHQQLFITCLQGQNLSSSSQRYYLYYVGRFFQTWSNPVENIRKKDILHYLSTLNHRQNITRRNHLIALRHYFACLHRHGLVASNPTALIKIRGTNKKILYPLFTFDQLMQLLDDYHHVFIRTFDSGKIPDNQRIFSHLKRHRNHVLLGLFVHQGIRTGEINSLRTDHIDLRRAQIHLPGRAPRLLPLHATQMGTLMLYLNEIRPQIEEYHTSETHRLFLPLPKSGEKTAQSDHWKEPARRLAGQVRQLRPDFLHFKQIRASLITRWIKLHGLRKAQYMAGHQSIVSTEQYLENDHETLLDDMEKYNPFR